MPLTPKNRKEEWLEGLVEHETTLTPKNRCESWMKEIIDASGGGGTGGGVLVATATTDEQAMTMTLDKTYNDIIAAPFTVVKIYDVDSITTAFISYTSNSTVSWAVYVAGITQEGSAMALEFSAESPDEPLVCYMG